MRYAIIGAGGIGGYLAAKLVEAGREVAVLARGAHLAAIRANGLTLRHKGEELTVPPAVATDVGAELGVADVTIFAVKGQDLAGAIEAARPTIGPETLALSYLNGVDAPDMLAAAYGSDHALIGVAGISAAIAEPGVIAVASPFADFPLGGLDGRQDAPRVAALTGDLSAAGISVPERPDMRVALWQKFVFLTALAGSTAGARCDMGAVRATPELWALFRRLCAEAVAVGNAKGVALGEGAVEYALKWTERLPDAIRASMAFDLSAGKPLELDWLNGAVVRLGAEVVVETPAHAAVTALLAPWRDGPVET